MHFKILSLQKLVWVLGVCVLNFLGEVISLRSNDIDSGSSIYQVGHPTSGGPVHPGKHNNVKDEKEDKVTDILHGLMSKYDNRIRPFYSDSAVFVTVWFGGVEVVDVLEGREEISSNVILQQSWIDPRLEFTDEESEGIESITISHENIRGELWLPDTFFENEVKPQGVENTVVNDAVILYKNGTVFRSVRMTVNTHCEFDYTDFPFDYQVCELRIGSHAYRDSDVKFGWSEPFIMDVDNLGANLSIVNSWHTGKFLIGGVFLNASTQEFNHGVMSRLTFIVRLQRAWKPFITRFYLPMVLFVFVSLVTLFCSDYRMALVIGLFNLAFVNIFVAIRSTSSDLPTKSTTLTAYDTYFVLCLTYMVLVLVVVAVKLIISDRLDQSYTVHQQQPSSSCSTANDRHNFPETLVLRQNRRRSDDHDIFSPGHHDEQSDCREENGVGGMSNGDEFQRIYRSTSYPVAKVGWRIVGRRVYKFGGWVWKHLRWILIGMFLITDYLYFKVHSVQYI